MKKILITLVLASSVLLAGCPTFTIGGWMPSESGTGKASFGGTFFCDQVGDDIVLRGQFQYTDHEYLITWRGKERPLNFHGTVGPITLEDTTCEDEDELYTFVFNDGYCGDAELKPAPKRVGDTGYDWDRPAFRIGLINLETREIELVFDNAAVIELGTDRACPDNPFGNGAPPYYVNQGMIGGGNIDVRYPIIE